MKIISAVVFLTLYFFLELYKEQPEQIIKKSIKDKKFVFKLLLVLKKLEKNEEKSFILENHKFEVLSSLTHYQRMIISFDKNDNKTKEIVFQLKDNNLFIKFCYFDHLLDQRVEGEEKLFDQLSDFEKKALEEVITAILTAQENKSSVKQEKIEKVFSKDLFASKLNFKQKLKKPND